SSFGLVLRKGAATFFYFAGHGVQVEGENYLLPTAVAARTEGDLQFGGLSLNYVMRTLRDSGGAPNIVVVDACRDNPFNATQASLTKRGLARIDPPLNTVLVYATAPDRPALDGEGHNSLFAKHLLQQLPVPGAKVDE